MIKVFLFCILIGFFYFVYSPPPASQCAFCDPEIVKRQKFYEDDHVIGLYNYKPVIEGHCLIIPKRHVERFEDLTSPEMLKMQKLIQKTHKASEKAFGASSYLLLQKNGKEVGQSVPHVHFHYVPKKNGNPFELLMRFLFHPLKGEISLSEIEEKIEQIQKAWEREPNIAQGVFI